VANRRIISTPPGDDDVWEAAEAVAATLGVPLSRVVASALREYAPIRVHEAAQEPVPAAQ
jgi:antitoxin component of RelBE/YafQ-DinJ toxin-antitoxin module